MANVVRKARVIIALLETRDGLLQHAERIESDTELRPQLREYYGAQKRTSARVIETWMERCEQIPTDRPSCLDLFDPNQL